MEDAISFEGLAAALREIRRRIGLVRLSLHVGQEPQGVELDEICRVIDRLIVNVGGTPTST
jgi:hypothetical protein